MIVMQPVYFHPELVYALVRSGPVVDSLRWGGPWDDESTRGEFR